jgi:ABC-type uncharacterized transport system substrate-binding protein
MLRRLPMLLLLLALPARALAEPRVVVLKSETSQGPVGPYEEAAKGVKDALSPTVKRWLEVVVSPTIPLDYTVQSVKTENPEVLVCFGAEAAKFANEQFPDVAKVIALAPGVGPPEGDVPAVVISSEVLPQVQMKWIGAVLPDVEKIGVVYDPKASRSLVEDLSRAAEAAGSRHGHPLSIVPIEVGSEGEVPDAFAKAKGGIQALLFVPDTTVTTKGTIGYLLKESLAAGIPSIGFNWYFVDNGAVLGFGIDYRALGRQSANAARKLVKDHTGDSEMPTKITVWVNSRVAQKLRIRTDYDPDKVQEIR